MAVKVITVTKPSEIRKCRNCGLRVFVYAETQSVAHEAPACEWFVQLLREQLGPPDEDQWVKLDDDGNVVGRSHGVGVVDIERQNAAKACTCTITRHERQENKSCPVHFPHR